MAITRCVVQRAATASFDRRNRGTYTATWEVQSDGNMGPKQLANAAVAYTAPAGELALPAFGTAYDLTAIYGAGESDPYSYAQSYGEITFADESRKVAYIPVTYTPLEPGETEDRRTITIPTNRGARFHWESEAYQDVIDKDRTGLPITNGAGRAFDRPLAIEKGRPLFIANFNVADQNTAIAITTTYDQAVNSVAWSAFGATSDDYPQPRTVVCRYARSGPTETENDVSFVPMTLAFAFAPAGGTWDERSVNEGYGHYKIQSGQVYGHATASSDWDSDDTDISLTDYQLAVNDSGSADPPSPGSTITRPTTGYYAEGKAGDAIPLLYSLSNWIVSDPERALSDKGVPVYQKAREIGEDGTETDNFVSEPVLLYQNGCRLPEGMKGNVVVSRARAEVDFNGLNTYFTATT